MISRLVILIICSLVLSACASNNGGRQTSTSTAPAGVKIGDPYKIAGKWYTPEENPTYNQVGIASWYGADFHNKVTANGETYNMNALSAAHTTLPMPSYVRVTNLENNRSLILRVNDRGPFVNNRLIDVSRRGAQLLGFETRGTTRVRVEAVDGPNAPIIIARSDDPPPLQAQEVAQVAVESLEILPPVQSGSLPPMTLPTPTPVDRRAPIDQQAPLDNQRLGSDAPLSGFNEPSLFGDNYVQVGAYSSIGRASSVISSIEHIGSASMESVVVGTRTLYRVRMGPMNTSTAATSALSQILNLGHNTAKIVVD